VTQLDNNPQADAAALQQRLKAIIDYVRDCQRRVSQGEIMDLKGLDQNVLELCDGVAALPPPEGRALEDQMTALITDLEALANAMRLQQEKMEAGDR
jgi:hypothetical protein